MLYPGELQTRGAPEAGLEPAMSFDARLTAE